MAPSVGGLLDFAEVVIFGNASREFKALETHAFRANQVVVDLTGVLKGKIAPPVEYHGICW